jgi:hypothetical protein
MRALLVTLLLLSACKTTPETQKGEGATVLVRLTRGACFGRCPVYAVKVSSAGDVQFDGTRDVLVTGPSSSTLDAATMKKLVTRLEGSGFAKFNAQYLKRTETDQPTVTLTFGGKTVEHYLGDETTPPELKQLEDDVDALIGTSQWITGRGAPSL